MSDLVYTDQTKEGLIHLLEQKNRELKECRASGQIVAKQKDEAIQQLKECREENETLFSLPIQKGCY